MSTAERTRDLIKGIASSYVKNVKIQAETNTLQRIEQLMNLTCGGEKNSCKQCLLNFFTLDQITGNNYTKNEDLIDKVRTTTCAGVCFCELEATQNMSVTFMANAQIKNPTNDELDKIVAEVNTTLKKKYGDKFQPTRQDIVDIIEGKDTTTSGGTTTTSEATLGTREKANVSLSSVINQSVNASQVITAAGNMQLKNIHMELLLSSVMNAVAENSMSIVNKTVQDSVDQIKRDVEASVKTQMQQVFEEFKNQFLTLLGILGLSFVILIGSYLFRAFRKL
jgi:hypothetical protein